MMTNGDKKLIPIFMLLLTGIVFLLYARTLNDPLFLWDDRYLIEQNAFIQDTGNIGDLFSKRYFSQVYELSWRPIGTMSIMANHAVNGASPTGYRIVNVGIHAINAILLFIFLMLLLSECGVKPPPWICFGVAALFAAHPVNTEAINGITFREDLLCLMFVLLSGIAYLLTRRRGGAAAAAASLLFTPALLSKETAVVFPAALLCMEFMALGNKNDPKYDLRAAFSRNLPYVLWAAAFLVLRFGPMRGPAEQFAYHGGGPADTFLFSCDAWRKYLQLVFYPVAQCFDYFQTGKPALSDPLYALALITFVAIMALPPLLLKRNRTAAFGAAWFILFLLPASNILPIGVTMAERYLYVPLAGISIAVAAVLYQAISKTKSRVRVVACIFMAAVFACLCVLTVNRNRVWSGEAGFWAQTASCSPHPAQSLVNLGLAYDRAGRGNEAVATLERAVDIAGDSDPAADRYGALYRAHGNLGMALARAGRYDDAVTHLFRALELHPGYIHAEKNLDAVAAQCAWIAKNAEQKGDVQSAIQQYKILLRIYPGDQELHEKIRRLERGRRP